MVNQKKKEKQINKQRKTKLGRKCISGLALSPDYHADRFNLSQKKRLLRRTECHYVTMGGPIERKTLE